ncbi:MAG: DNA ligase D [Chitinophagaceae bacterium]
MAVRSNKVQSAKKRVIKGNKDSLRVTAPLKRIKNNSIQIDAAESVGITWALEQFKREYRGIKKVPMPRLIKPTLCSAAKEPFNDKDWQFEIKWDGYRAIAYMAGQNKDLLSRNNLSFNLKFEPVYTAINNWQINAVVDGEIVVVNEHGAADFEALQGWHKEQKGTILYYVFDLLWLDGIDLQSEPLVKRQEILRSLIPPGSPIRFSGSIDEYGIDFFKAAKDNGLEGIIAKEKFSPYTAGRRTEYWYKIKAETKHEAIICGFTKKKGTSRLFSSLILGIPNEGSLQYIGQVGTGFNQQVQQKILELLKNYLIDDCPFPKKPIIRDEVQWVLPKYICEVKYTERTSEGVMRHPSFQGIREDKTAKDYNNDRPVATPEFHKKEAHSNLKNDVIKNMVDRGIKGKIISVDGEQLTLTNLSKAYWPQEKITKGDLLNYYHSIAQTMLPYIKDRPQSLNRFPGGIEGKSFYQKNMKGKLEPWLTLFARKGDAESESLDFLVCKSEATLLYMVNLGCIEINPWHSRVQSPLQPDWCVIDLDPGTVPFEKVIETAIVVHQLLESLSIPSYPKTSGSTGMHIYIPLGGQYNYEQSRQLAELIATMVHSELPSFTSIVRSPEKRKGKLYIDYLQNRSIQTICAPYSVRPKPGATVSAPLHWDEVKKGLTLSQFTIKNMQVRINNVGDLFAGLLGKGIDLNAVLKTLALNMNH